MDLIGFKEKLFSFFDRHLPNSRDNIKQILIKCLYILSLVAVLVSGTVLSNFFTGIEKENRILEELRAGFTVSGYSVDGIRAENPDIKGWLSFEGLGINYPLLQGEDNSFYLNHNSKKKKSTVGSLLIDYRTDAENDRNIIIYGNDNKDGSMFGELDKLRNAAFYRKNSVIRLNLSGNTRNYKIYAVFVLNSSKKDDNNYIYNISRKEFLNDEDFNSWVSEAKTRSVVNTGVTVENGDSVLTLVTSSDDFPNSRLIVMAKSGEENGYELEMSSNASANPQPVYPERWYTLRGIEKNIIKEEYENVSEFEG